MTGSDGLTRVRTEHLVEVLRAIHRGSLICPVDRPRLATAGFLGIAEGLDHLRGLDSRAATAVIVAVLAERRAAGTAPR